MKTLSSSTMQIRRMRQGSRSAWWSARTRNVLRRRQQLVAFGALLSLTLLAALLIVPGGAQALLDALRTSRVDMADTVAPRERVRQTSGAVAAADSVLSVQRQTLQSILAVQSSPVVRESDPVVDSLAQAVASLQALIARAEEAPLAESYRAIAESPFVRDEGRVRALLDSLADIERERDEFGSGATVDPVFVALTTRANAFGRQIVAVAQSRHDAIARDLETARTRRPSQPQVVVELPDTVGAARVRDAAMASLQSAESILQQARARNALALTAASRAQRAIQLAPPLVLAAAAIVIGSALVFAIFLIDEVRSPRIGDQMEAERLADARVVTRVRLRDVPPNRMRRETDREQPRLLDPGFDAYRMIAWHASAQAPKDRLLVVTGESPEACAIIAANVAAVLAQEARATLVVDIDFQRRRLADVLEIPVDPGIAAVLENKRRWPETVVQITAGRSQVVDVIPSGLRTRELGAAEGEALAAEIRRAARRYDLTLVVAPLRSARRIFPGADTLLCAMVARTRLSTLARTAATVRDGGSKILGVALWEGDLPPLLNRRVPRTPDTPGTRRARSAA